MSAAIRLMEQSTRSQPNGLELEQKMDVMNCLPFLSFELPAGFGALRMCSPKYVTLLQHKQLKDTPNDHQSGPPADGSQLYCVIVC